MAQTNLANGSLFGAIRAAINTMFTEVYAAIASLTSSVSTRQSIAAAWDGTTPALASGVNPMPLFGSNAFEYTGTGTHILDGNTYYPGDIAVFGTGGSSVFTRIPAGGSYLGIFTSGTLPAAATNASNFALVGTGAPYAIEISNGSAWITIGSGGATLLASLTDMGTYDLGTNNPSVATIKATANAAIPSSQKGVAGGVAPNNDTVQITGNVTITTANQATYNGKTLEWTGAFAVTLSTGLAASFGFAGIPPASGNASIVSDGTITLNGATTTQTRTAAGYTMFAVTQRSTSANAYVVS